MSRIEELGIPIPRKLIATKQEFDHVLERRKLQNLDKHLEKSLNTVYCKMVAHRKRTTFSQTHLRKKNVAFTSDEHKKWLLNISKPKKVFDPEVTERTKGKVDADRMVRLSRPRHFPCPEPDLSQIAASALKYVPTERILTLATPRKEKEDDIVYGVPRISFPINPEYAAVQSLGIDQLSRPPHPKEKYRKFTADVRCSYIPVSKGALHYEASPKIRKLAKPRTVEEEELANADVYKVKKKALKKLGKKQEKIFAKMSTPVKWRVTPKFEKE